MSDTQKILDIFRKYNPSLVICVDYRNVVVGLKESVYELHIITDSDGNFACFRCPTSHYTLSPTQNESKEYFWVRIASWFKYTKNFKQELDKSNWGQWK